MDKSCLLIQALKEGKLLSRHYERSERKEYFFAYILNDELFFESKGWMSGIGNFKDRLSDIITHPELWEIDEFEMSQGYPYPWSNIVK